MGFSTNLQVGAFVYTIFILADLGVGWFVMFPTLFYINILYKVIVLLICMLRTKMEKFGNGNESIQIGMPGGYLILPPLLMTVISFFMFNHWYFAIKSIMYFGFIFVM